MSSELFTAWLFVVGLCVGSFLNVVIARLPEDISLVSPRSRCPHCGHQLHWYENIPLFSFIALRGRCSACRAPISWMYPAVELLTGVLFIASLLVYGWTRELIVCLTLVMLLIPLTFIDLKHWLLPFEITLPGIVAGIALSALISLQRTRDAGIGALVGFGAFWIMEVVGRWLFRKEALGGGDKYLLALIGAFLTYRPLLGVVLLASVQGAIVGVALLAIRGRAGPAPAGREEQLRGEVLLEKLAGSRSLDLKTARPSEELLSSVPRAVADEHRVLPLGRVGPVLLVATSAQPLSASAKEALRTHTSASEVESVRAPASELQQAIERLYGSATANPNEVDDDDWVPGPTNIPFGPWLSLAALEIVLGGGLLARIVPDPFAFAFSRGLQ